MSRTDSDRTRAAASSMASGSPSSDRHTSSTSTVVSASRTNRAPHLPGAVREQRHRVLARERLERVDAARRPRRAAPGWWRGSAGRRPRSSSEATKPLTLLDQVLAVVEQQHGLGAGEPLDAATAPRRRRAASRPPPARDGRRRRRPRRAAPARPRRAASEPAATSSASRVLPDAGRSDDRHQPMLGQQPRAPPARRPRGRPAGRWPAAGSPGRRPTRRADRLSRAGLCRSTCCSRSRSAGPGSMPELVDEQRRAPGAYAASASACRPAR